MEKYSASFGSLKALSEDESQTKSELSAKAFFELSEVLSSLAKRTFCKTHRARETRQVRSATENRADKGSVRKFKL